jgi:hypothetical protein
MAVLLELVEVDMAFKTLFIAHAPDAAKDVHRSVIDTGMYRLSCVVVKDQAEAMQVVREFVAGEQIDSVLLCPGFTHADVAEIVQATDGAVSVGVARSDGPSGRIVQAAFRREGYPGTSEHD